MAIGSPRLPSSTSCKAVRPLVGSKPRLVILGAPQLLGLLLGRRIEHAHQPLGGKKREKRGQWLGLLAHALEGRLRSPRPR